MYIFPGVKCFFRVSNKNLNFIQALILRSFFILGLLFHFLNRKNREPKYPSPLFEIFETFRLLSNINTRTSSLYSYWNNKCYQLQTTLRGHSNDTWHWKEGGPGGWQCVTRPFFPVFYGLGSKKSCLTLRLCIQWCFLACLFHISKHSSLERQWF